MCGLLDNQGNIIVPTNYKALGKYNEYANDIALVETMTGKYGFVDRNGKEVVVAKYDLKEIKENFHQIYPQ